MLQIGVDEVHFCTMLASWLSISPACGRKQFPSKISTMRFRVDTCVEGNTPETSQSQKRTEFSRGLGETWGYTHKWAQHFPGLPGKANVSQKQTTAVLPQGHKSRYQKPHRLSMVWLYGSTSFNWSIYVDYLDPMSLVARE